MDKKLILFGKHIALLRKQKNYTQEQLAELVDYSPNHISKLELARTNPSFDLIMKISKALDVSARDLFDFESEHNTNNEIINKITVLLRSMKPKEQEFIYNTVKNLKKISYKE